MLTALRSEPDPLVVDLGYGRVPVTTLELATRLRAVAGGVRVIGLEIDPQRVADAEAGAGNGVEFRLGGFELAGTNPVLVRAFNVLRQYPEDAVWAAWTTMQSRLAPTGVIVDGTCDELGRLGAWVLLDRAGPVSVTLACDPRHIEKPSVLAADRAWATAAGQAVFGPRARWHTMLSSLAAAGHPVTPPRRSQRDAVLTVPWTAVAPAVG